MQIFVSYHSIQFKTSFCELLFALCQRGVHLSVWEIRKAAVLGGEVSYEIAFSLLEFIVSTKS